MRLTILAILIWLVPSLSAQDVPPFNSEPESSGVPMRASEAASRVELPPGFQISVFAAEPQVQNPIAMAWDAKGRLWIGENYTYAERGKQFELKLRDRVLVFEDRGGGAGVGSRKVFLDDVQRLTSVEVGMGGIWLMCPPQLLFVPDRDFDDVPDGPAEVVLDGFTLPPENYHNFANGLRFGPDGWLYGRCGASSPGDVGAPGVAAEKRIPLRGTMWRFHPTTKVFEALASGTTNPWGHDWNSVGELFFINTVNGHLWHGITGAHFVRPHTIDPNPHIYQTIDMHADHWHFDTASDWTKSRGGVANAYGGGHAHVGAMIYLGDNWPAQYRDRLFTWNMHGRRANQEILVRHGSGYVGKHGPDVFISSDPWFRGMELSYGPDGAVYVIDWIDTGECHDFTGVHRTSGRIYKLTYGNANSPAAFDFTKMSIKELLDRLKHPNEWYSRQARLEISRRWQGSGEIFGRSLSIELKQRGVESDSTVEQLRRLWASYVGGILQEQEILDLLQHSDEHIRVWAVRLLSDRWPLDSVLGVRPDTISSGATDLPSPAILRTFEKRAQIDPSPLVRLGLASVLQRLPVGSRLPIATALLGRSEDANDYNLPLMIWYGIAPIANEDGEGLAKAAVMSQIPLVRKLAARRLAEDADSRPVGLNALLRLGANSDAAVRADLVNGIAEGLVGWRKATRPGSWEVFVQKLGQNSDDSVKAKIRTLSAQFGDGVAVEEILRVALDRQAELGSRKAALKALITHQAPNLRNICDQLLSTRFLNRVAASGLAAFGDVEAGKSLARSYRSFHPSDRPFLIETLITRKEFAMALMEEIETGTIPRSELSLVHVRQILGFKQPDLDSKLRRVWGEVQGATKDYATKVAMFRDHFTPANLISADKSQGRQVFTQVCASCHRLYGMGGDLGPDLTGSGRQNLDYLLENLLEPGAVVGADYATHQIRLKDGREFSAIVGAKTARTTTFRLVTETLVVENSEIDLQSASKVSMMPEGLLESLTPRQQLELIAYLMAPTQVK